MYLVLVSFATADETYTKGQVIELTDQDEIKDLTDAGYIKEFTPPDFSKFVRYQEQT